MRIAAPHENVETETSIDGFLDGSMMLEQPRKGHRIGTDAMLLAASAPPQMNSLADMGAGVGAVGIAAALMHPNAAVMLVENDPIACALARSNVERNGLGDRVRVAELDIFSAADARSEAGLGAGSIDLVLTNPPFFSDGEGRPSPIAQKRRSHVMENGDLDGWMRAAAFFLKPRGTIVLIHRADAIARLLTAMTRRFGALRLLFLHKNAAEPATRILVKAVLGSRAPLEVLPPLYLHGADGRFTDEAKALHMGQGRIDWATGTVVSTHRAGHDQ